MGTTELSASRVRNKKRRQGYKRRLEFGRSYESGSAVVKTTVTKDMTEKDIMAVWNGFTDDKWRAECEISAARIAKDREQEMLAKRLNKENEAYLKANDKQYGGDHYKNMGVEPWDVLDTWPIEQRIGAYRHGALKYLMRMGSKDEQLQEIKKCGHYIEKLIEVLGEENDNA